MRLGRLFSSELGNNPYVPKKKEWIATAIGVIGGLASSFLGGQAASSAAEAAERRQRAQEAKDNADYTRKKYEDVGDTAWGQNQLRRVEQFNKKNWRRAKGAQAVGGGTDAATQMSKDAGNQLMADTMGNMAAANVARQEHADAVHQANQQKYMQMDMARDMQRAQNTTNASQAASNAIMQMGSAFENGTSLAGGSNKGIQPMTEAVPTSTTPDVAPTISSNIKGGTLGSLANDATDEQALRAKRLIGGY